MGAALGTWGTSWIAQLLLDAVVWGASCSAVTPRSSWQSWMRAADIPDVEQSMEVLLSAGMDCPQPCKLVMGSACAIPRPVPAAQPLPHAPAMGRCGGESVNVPSHNKPLCMGGPET